MSKTKAQDDAEYADGSKLGEAIGNAVHVEYLIGATGCKPPAAKRRAVKQMVRQARRQRHQQRRAGLFKAVKLLWMGRSSLLWVVAQSAMSVIHASITATVTYYRAGILESFQEAGFTWDKFRRQAIAVLYVELTLSLLTLLVQALRTRGQAVLGTKMRILYFDALQKKDLQWWAKRIGRP